MLKMNIQEKIKNYFSKKSKLSIASDFLFVALLIAFLIPQSRMQLGAAVNKVKMLFVQPSTEDASEMKSLSAGDYDMVFQDLNGQNLEFSTLKGKVIFMNLWATWCPPCVAEMPSIQELYEKYKNNSDVVFLMVSNEDQGTIQKFMQKRGFTFPVYINKFRMPDAFYTQSIPTTFVISKSGKIVIHETGATDWAGKKMTDIMNQLIMEK